MATFEDMLRRTNGTPTGVPNAPAVPGGGPTPSTPPTNVNPPAAATAPVGRPPAPPPLPAGGTGSALPITPGAGGQAAPSSGAGPTRNVSRPPMPGGQTPAAPTPPGGGNTGAGIQTGVTATPLVYQLDHVPDAAERMSMPPGAQITTPYGSVDHMGNLIPSPEGAAKYQQAMVSARRSYGPHPWADDPQAPPPPVKLGRMNFNMFTGKWQKAQ